MKLDKIILNIAKSGLKSQNPNGSMEAGVNGPWNDFDTPVRNTSNWLKIFLYCYKNSKETIFLKSSKKCLNYLISKESIPYHISFHCRKNTNKKSTNGLIGQAWALEALYEYYSYFKEDKIAEIFNKIASSHDYDEKKHLWKEMEIDGSNKSVCLTFNQQLWFAVTLLKAKKILNRINRKRAIDFINNIENTISTYENGLILHPIILSEINALFANKFLKIAKINLDKKLRNEKILNLSIGYNLFNIYAFAMLEGIEPKSNFLKSKKFKKIIEYSFTDEFINKLNKNEYSYQYNAPGFEFPIILNHFCKDKKKIINMSKFFIQKQFDLTFDKNCFEFNKNTCDSKTLTGRIYELTRIPKDMIEEIEINI